MNKKQEVLSYLREKVFDPVLLSNNSSSSLKKGVRLTIMRLEQRDVQGIVNYFWSAIVGTDKSTAFAKMMKDEGFTRFEEVIDEFRVKFDNKWLRS